MIRVGAGIGSAANCRARIRRSAFERLAMSRLRRTSAAEASAAMGVSSPASPPSSPASYPVVIAGAARVDVGRGSVLNHVRNA